MSGTLPMPPLPAQTDAGPEPLQQVDEKYVTVLRLQSALILIAASVALVVLNIGLWDDFGWWSAGVSTALWLVAVSVGVGLLPPTIHKHLGFRLTSDGLTLKKGVLWRSRIFIPASRVQHTDVAQGPLLRRYRLAQLVVHTAGTLHAQNTLPGLTYQQALELREALTGEGEQGV